MRTRFAVVVRLRTATAHTNRYTARRAAAVVLVVSCALALAADLAAQPQPAPPVPALGQQPTAQATTKLATPADGGPDAAATADGVAAQFMMRCSGCHTIGGGPLTGPDLRTASQKPPADLRTAIKLMEKRVGPIDDAFIEELIAFLKDPTAADRVEEQRQRLMAEAMAKHRPSAEEGRRLFVGTSAFASGGPACAACHQIHGEGGNLAPDLSALGAKMGPLELVAAFEKPGFAVMRTVYAAHPVSTQEAFHLAAYLQKAAAEPAPEIVPDDVMTVATAGGAIAIVLLGLLAVGVRNRASGTRARLVSDSHRR